MHGPVNDPVRDLLSTVEKQAARSGFERGARLSTSCAFLRGAACGVVFTLVVVGWWAA